jgi:glutamate synthase (NADPH) small chain
MGNPRGFLDTKRQRPDCKEPTARIEDFSEFVLPRDDATRQAQGGRCMDCGVPFCMSGCPLGNRIPDFNHRLYKGRTEAAWRVLTATNNFPEFTGRVCPAPCEAACVLNLNDEPVTIEDNERDIAEAAWEAGLETPRPQVRSTGKRVAIVGSGPAGLAAAQQLVRRGHSVTVFERDEQPGGLLRFGIPDFKLDKSVVVRRLDQLCAEGVRFQTGVDVGRHISWQELKDSHDAMLVAIGAGRPRDLSVEGRDLKGVGFAMEFLKAQNRAVRDGGQSKVHAGGQRVVILGGGDTGSDCLGTALRQGAADVLQIELFPSPPDSRGSANPWPEWPVMLRTSSSQREGGTRKWGLMTTRLEGIDGVLTHLCAEPVEVVDGRPTPTGEPEVKLPVDRLILAMGFLSPVVDSLRDQLGLSCTQRDVIAVDEAFRTSMSGVYAAGDASRGASLVVWAIADGRRAAASIHADLSWREAEFGPLSKDNQAIR